MLKFFHRRYSGAGFVAGLMSVAVPCSAPAAGVERGLVTLSSPRIEVAWQAYLPSSQTMHYTSFHLLDGRIYAIGTNGTVAAVRADNGEIVWLRALVEEGNQLWPPTAYYSQKGNAVGFTRSHDLILVDPKTGATNHVLTSARPNISSAAFSPEHVYLANAGSHLSAYRLKDNYIHWRASFDATLTLPPAYVPELNILAAADDSGLVCGLKNVDRTEDRVVFKQIFRSRPRGWLAVDGSMLYLSTDNQILHAIAMNPSGPEHKPGQVLWQYRLAKPPEGGPLLTASAIYQATIDGGLHRLPKFPGEFKAWYAPEARRFLAEWSDGVVVLTKDDKVALIRDNPAKPIILADAAGYSADISNTLNDAVYLTAPKGAVCCLRPANAAPLKLASFMPTSAPATAPEEQQAETFLERIHRESQERKAKRNKTQVAEIKIPPAPQSQPGEAAAKAEASATPPPPYDPLRSNVPVVK